MKRTKLKDRALPYYCNGEEIMNMVTHITGGGLGIIMFVLCCWKGIISGSGATLTGCMIYGFSLVGLYSISSVYHGLRTNTSKKVLQVIDHCAIYFLIAGTYTPILLTAFIPATPAIGWSLLGLEWSLAILAATLTAIDLDKYNVFSMICYIFMGWAIIFVLPIALQVIGYEGFMFLLAGGITYTIGAILYGIGSKVSWMHAIFHIFVVLGSLLQFLAIFLYVL